MRLPTTENPGLEIVLGAYFCRIASWNDRNGGGGNRTRGGFPPSRQSRRVGR
jgi:hypothetical protein